MYDAIWVCSAVQNRNSWVAQRTIHDGSLDGPCNFWVVRIWCDQKWKWNNNIVIHVCYLFSTNNKKAWHWYFKLSYRLVTRQQGCQATPAIFQSTCLECFKTQPHKLESSRDIRDLKIRRLSYNLVNIGPVSMSLMWKGVSETYFGNSSVAKRTTLPATMGRPLGLWVAFGDRATVFGQHWVWCHWNDQEPIDQGSHRQASKNFNDFSMILQDKIPNFHDNTEHYETENIGPHIMHGRLTHLMTIIGCF